MESWEISVESVLMIFGEICKQMCFSPTCKKNCSVCETLPRIWSSILRSLNKSKISTRPENFMFVIELYWHHNHLAKASLSPQEHILYKCIFTDGVIFVELFHVLWKLFYKVVESKLLQTWINNFAWNVVIVQCMS